MQEASERKEKHLIKKTGLLSKWKGENLMAQLKVVVNFVVSYVELH